MSMCGVPPVSQGRLDRPDELSACEASTGDGTEIVHHLDTHRGGRGAYDRAPPKSGHDGGCGVQEVIGCAVAILAGAAIELAGAAIEIAFPPLMYANRASANTCMWCDTPNVQFFASPSGNICCEIDYRQGDLPDSAYCVSVNRHRTYPCLRKGCCRFAAVATAV
jgi:hypothetical protein